MHDPRAHLGREVVDLCRRHGFARAGVTGAEPSAWGDEFRRWLDEGRHGSMGWLAEHVDVKLDPGKLLDGARAVVMVADQYARRGEADDGPPEPGTGRIARYARGRDYHKVIKKRLHAVCDALGERFPEARFRAFTDTAPVMERELAARAGLGWIGKHTLLIDPKLGSYLFLGGFVTTLDLLPPPSQPAPTDHCGSCTRCIDACPTGCITPYSVDASRCLAYLTIERREAIDPGFFPEVGDWIFGCDVCQEVCPHNSPRHSAWARANTGKVTEAYTPRRAGFDLLEVLGWGEADRAAAFEGTALKRARLDMFKRNAVIAAGNALREGASPHLRAQLMSIADASDEPPMVREAARAVLAQVDGGGSEA